MLHQFHGRLTPCPPHINHRSLADHDTNYVAQIAECRYQCRQTSPPPPIDHKSLEDHYTISVSWQTDTTPLLQLTIDLWQTNTLCCTYCRMHRYQCRQTSPPPPIDHKSLEDHYTISVSWQTDTTPLLQLTIDLWQTNTLCCTYCRMHRYQCRQTPPPPPIDHRSLVNHYTDYVSHIDICIDTSVDRPHPLLQLAIDKWKSTTLTIFHI